MQLYMVVMGIHFLTPLLMANQNRNKGETPGVTFQDHIINIWRCHRSHLLTRHSSQIAAQIHILHCLKTWKRTSLESFPTKIHPNRNLVHQKPIENKKSLTENPCPLLDQAIFIDPVMWCMGRPRS